MNFARIDSSRINRLTERVFSLPGVIPPPAMTYAEKVIARRKLLRSGASFEKVDQIVPMSGYYSNQNTMNLSSLNLDYSLGGTDRFSPARLLSVGGWLDAFLGNDVGEVDNNRARSIRAFQRASVAAARQRANQQNEAGRSRATQIPAGAMPTRPAIVPSGPAIVPLQPCGGLFDGFLGKVVGEDAAGALVAAGTTAATNAITGNSGNQSAPGGGGSVPAASEPFYKTGIGMAAIGGVALLGLVLVMKGKKRRR